uniref:Fatty acid hydroxylase domain-containing protein n=1 Tax=Helicotheca tamesis TaxID=374047 RepID=A0A7S2E2C4_9STRA|mmetsp:Transcript_11458/g.15891  ORF Transcript_11458/g.15891 Transcript_11458/m.15891 type:complete len:379 (+) Transcript_11458:26-1162(+)
MVQPAKPKGDTTTQERRSSPASVMDLPFKDQKNVNSDHAVPKLESDDGSQTSQSECSADISAAKNPVSNSAVTGSSSSMQHILPWTGLAIWPLMLTLPLLLTSPYSFTSYSEVFSESMYSYDASTGDDKPKPLGLCLGILAVAIGMIFIVVYFYLHRSGALSCGIVPTSIQTKGAPSYEFAEGVATHLAQPEGFVLLTAYLSITWMCNLMPSSYYSFEGSIQWFELALCLVIQDGIQYTMHRLEHAVSPEFYKKSHKPHHRFTNPRMFDAFNGSLPDTILMILVPLYCTANIVRTCNVWTYMAFGSIYANWLTLIHSEYALPWDKLFRRFGMGTPGDHHVHHKFFKYNYGHLFMWFDMLCGTYRCPDDVDRKYFNAAA